MGRVRLGVALLVPAPVAAELDGLRRALGDGALGRIPPHLTLVPPVNVRHDDLPAALAVLRAAAAATAGPVEVTLGPVATFHPDNPVVFLAVGPAPDAAGAGTVADDQGAANPGPDASGPDASGRDRSGDDRSELRRLRDRVFRAPLARPLTWPFLAHVTLGDDLAPDRIPAALAALAHYRASVTFTNVHLLAEGAGRVWAPLADSALGPPVVVGRGGLPVELWRSARPDPEAAAVLGAAAEPGIPAGATPFTVTARREGVVLGAACGWRRDGETTLAGLAVTLAAGAEDIERHLRHVALDLADP